MYAYLRQRSVSLSTKRRGEDCANLRQQLKFFLLAHGKETNPWKPELQHKENVQKSNGGKYIYIIYWYNISCYSACLLAVAGGAGGRVLPSSSSSSSRWCDIHDDKTQTTRKCASQSWAYKLQGVCWQSAKAKMKNRHFTGGYRGSKPFFLTLQTGRKFPLGTEENIIGIGKFLGIYGQ